MARALKGAFTVKLGNTQFTGLMKLTGLKRTREKVEVRDGDSNSDVNVILLTGTKHDDVTITCSVQPKVITQLEKDFDDHGNGDEDTTAGKYDTVTITSYSDAKNFKNPVMNYALNQVRIIGLEYGELDRSSNDPQEMMLTLAAASGKGSDASSGAARKIGP